MRKIFILLSFIFFSLFSRVAEAQHESQTMAIIKDFAAYNLWANRAYVTWLNSADSSQFHQHVESSFKSLAETVVHLWNAEHGWLNTLLDQPWGDPPSKTFEGKQHQEILSAWLLTSEALANHVQQLSDEQIARVFTRKDGSSLGTAAQIMLHVFNHATYHRGQLITMGRQVGLQNPPRADYIYYISEQQNK
jgi:uncharacterized damage-inducible protein DinB